MTDLLLYHPSHFSPFLPGLTDAHITHLLACSRLTQRLAAFVQTDDCAVEENATNLEQFVSRPWRDVLTLGRMAAAIYHGPMLRACVVATDVEKIEEVLTPEIRRKAFSFLSSEAGQKLNNADFASRCDTPPGTLLQTSIQKALARWVGSLPPRYQNAALFRVPRTIHSLQEPCAFDVILPLAADFLLEGS